MASQIDVTKPETVQATTASVRQNFAYAKEEIEAAQAAMTAHDIGTYTHIQIDTHIDNAALHRIINDAGTSLTELWSANKINTELTTQTHVEADITDLDHTDDDAIHDDTANEISGIAEKALPVANDIFIIEDSAASYVKKKLKYSNLGGGFEATTKCWFYQAAAPTGWTIEAGLGDRLLAVHGYSGSAGGGEQQGAWTISGLSGGGHALSVAQMPQHRHYNYPRGYYTHGACATANATYCGRVTYNYTNYQGSSSSHSHSVSHNGTWRPAANVGIIASKD